jgi:hypothetical protein
LQALRLVCAELYQKTTYAESAARKEATNNFISSTDTVHLLSACFRNLREAKMLEYVEIGTPGYRNVIFTALSLADFPRKIVKFPVEPDMIAKHDE